MRMQVTPMDRNIAPEDIKPIDTPGFTVTFPLRLP
jgi:hypothetical protein